MYIVAGEKGCGKTSLLKALVLEHNLSVQGFLSIKELSAGIVTGIHLLLFPEQKIIPMATTTPITTNSRTKYFYFYPKVFSFVNRHFERIHNDLAFIFDEFGVLEMDQKGHFPIFEHLKKTNHRTLVVVRAGLLDDFVSTFCMDTDYTVLNIKKSETGLSSQNILDFLS
jgi:nucleoside-triphosphatase THEP1